MTLEIALPPLDDRMDPEIELRPVFLEEWVEGLPYADPDALLARLTDTLERFDRGPVKPALRIALLDIYARAYRYLLDLREGHGPVHGVSAIERYRATGDGARRVAAAIALGYQIALAGAAAKRGLMGAGKEVKQGTQRALLFLELSLLHSYDQYLPVTEGLWAEMHALHGFAEDNGLRDTSGPGPGGREDLGGTCATLYKRALLASLADPYHLAYGDVWKVNRALRRAAARATLGPYEAQRPAGGLFVVEPREDSRPLPYRDIDEPGPLALLLDVNPVIEDLKGQIARPEAGGPPVGLLAGMVRNLGLPPRRHTPREATRGRARLTTGVSSVYHFLGGPGLADTRAETVDGDPGPDLGDGEIAAAGHAYSAEFWEVTDEGPGGIGVLKSIRPNIPIGVGEIVGIHGRPEVDLERDWALGVVRWLNIAKAGEYQAGVQVLAHGVRAAALRRVLDGASEPERAALWFPGPAGSHSESVITAGGAYVEGAVVALRDAAGEHRGRIAGLVERGGGFEHFTVKSGGG